jgi:hypothetical protein
MSDEHIVLLGDLKGTKSYLSRPSHVNILAERLAKLHTIFARQVLSYLDRSRSLHAYCFSDSVLVRWDDAEDGVRTAPGFASTLWAEVASAGLEFRVFLEYGSGVPVMDDVGRAIHEAIGRYEHIIPVSMAVWSVFVAEESHFPEGVFIGDSIASRLARSGLAMGSAVYQAGPFGFRKVWIAE